jgi:hypothetical protein
MTTRRPRLPPLPKDWPATTAKAFRAWQRAVARFARLPAGELDFRERDREIDRLQRTTDKARSVLRYLTAADAERIDDSIASVTRDALTQFSERRAGLLKLKAAAASAAVVRPLSAAERQYQDEIRAMLAQR